MLKIFKKLLLSIILLTLLGGSNCAAWPFPLETKNFASLPAENDSIPNSETIFNQILFNLPETIPVHLPTYIPSEGVNRKGLAATLVIKTNSAYQIAIGTPGCKGEYYCRYATVSGEKITPYTPSIESEFSYMVNDPNYRPTRRSPDKMGSITLAGGVRGYFVPWVLGANLSDAKVIWNEGSYRYLVGVKGGSFQGVVRMANSAIQGKNQ